MITEKQMFYSTITEDLYTNKEDAIESESIARKTWISELVAKFHQLRGEYNTALETLQAEYEPQLDIIVTKLRDLGVTDSDIDQTLRGGKSNDKGLLDGVRVKVHRRRLSDALNDESDSIIWIFK